MFFLHYIIYWFSFLSLYSRMYALCHDICVSLIFVSSIPALFFYGIFVTWRCKFFYSIFYKVFYVAKI